MERKASTEYWYVSKVPIMSAWLVGRAFNSARGKVLGSFCSAIRIAIASEPPLRARVCAAPQGTRPKAQHQKLGCHEKWLQSPQPTMARPTFSDLKPQ